MAADGELLTDSMKDEYEFFAFISYKRGEADEARARCLQRELERYRVPVNDLPREETRVHRIFPRRLRVFRDKTDLGTHSTLGQGLSENLDASRFLIVVCSRRSADSPHVDAEVRRFVKTGRAENIIPFFIEGADKRGQFPRPPSLPPEMVGVAASEGREEAFVHLLSRLLRVDYENLLQAHLRASRRRTAFKLRAVVVFAALIVGLGLWAVAAENRATAWREETEGLAEFLTFDVIRETTAWLPWPERASITEKVSDYYARWEPRTPRAAFAYAVNLNQLGSIEANIAGKEESAIELILQALEVLEDLNETEPDNERIFDEYSYTLLAAGRLFETLDRMERAGIFYQKGLDVSRAFLAIHPESLAGMGQVADSLESLAKLSAAREKYEEAEAFYRDCGGMWADMLRQWPDETKTWLWRMRYGNFHSGHGYVKILQNDFTGALEHIGEALTVFEGFYEEDPKNLIMRLFYADELQTAAFAAAKGGALDEGEFFYAAGEELWRGLVAEDPQPVYVFGWARILTTGGLISAAQNRWKEAGKLLDEAEELIDGLIRLDPGSDVYLSHKLLIEESQKKESEF
ncbi:MAG: toll/interleukin-1 receptor domain-containing protein [Synergistaceae bacterium]|jgi:tetratricopeptide (TPR) repeat protein|nr:toll/interleukin-1 receptor domain-containing protein [Synergistaceae bacterium]